MSRWLFLICLAAIFFVWYCLADVSLQPSSGFALQLAQPPNAGEASIEIANGNGVRGVAARLRLVLARQGFVIARLSNAPPYIQQVTQIRYRAVFEKQATLLRAVLQDRHAILHAMQWNGAIDIKVVLGKGSACRVVAAAAIARKYETIDKAAVTGS